MEPLRLGVYVVVAVVASTSMLSGPLVGAVDLTPVDRSAESIGQGQVDLSVQTVPTDGVVLKKGKYGSGTYSLVVPDAVVDIESVEGNPLLAYRIQIHAFNFTRVTTTVLDEEMQGVIRVQMAPGTFQPSRVQQEQYAAELTLLVRADGHQRVLERTDVTIEVTE